MAGAVVIIVVVVLAPVVFCLGFAVLAPLLGQALWKDGEDRNEGSELLDVGV